MSKLKQLVVIGMFSLTVCACSPYVNIPSQPGDTFASNNPNNENVQDVVVAAIQSVIKQRPIQGSYQVVLPRGTDPVTYAKLLPRLGEHAMWSSSGVTGDSPVIEIRHVRIRGTEAAVDVLRPASQDINAGKPTELVTVNMTRYIPGGWAAKRIRIWRGDVDEALRISAGQPAADTPMPDEQPAPAEAEQTGNQ